VEAGRTGGSSETAAGAATGASGEVDAEDVVRGRVVEATFCAGCDLCVVGCDEVSREKSSRMFRAASHPDKSNKLTPTVDLIRLLIVIPPT
jgi:Fe-S-cluster-containing dehydrogenase component